MRPCFFHVDNMFLCSRDSQSGWLDTKNRMMEPWVKYWWVFENRIMKWAASPEDIPTTTNIIRFEEILLFKTDVCYFVVSFYDILV